jgi:hypothetical protein
MNSLLRCCTSLLRKWTLLASSVGAVLCFPYPLPMTRLRREIQMFENSLVGRGPLFGLGMSPYVLSESFGVVGLCPGLLGARGEKIPNVFERTFRP